MRGFIDASGLGAKTADDAAPAARRAKAQWRGLAGGGKLWPALAAGGVGAATMVVASLGSIGEKAADPTVALTIADPACARSPATCYPLDAIPEFKEELRKAMAAPAAAADNAVQRSVTLPLEGGLVRERAVDNPPRR